MRAPITVMDNVSSSLELSSMHHEVCRPASRTQWVACNLSYPLSLSSINRLHLRFLCSSLLPLHQLINSLMLPLCFFFQSDRRDILSRRVLERLPPVSFFFFPITFYSFYLLNVFSSTSDYHASRASLGSSGSFSRLCCFLIFLYIIFRSYLARASRDTRTRI